MARNSLSGSVRLGTGSASSLLRSSNSLQTQIANYNDSLQAFQYANSAYTDDAYKSYAEYLQGRIDSLNQSGTLSGAQKALTLTKTLEAATKSNTTATIQRENIQVMAGNATPMDKYNVIVSQYTRAVGNGDMTLAQTLMSQAYSLSQQIQYQRQQAQNARDTLARAGAISGSSSESTYQGEIVTNLKDSLKYFNGLAKNAGETELNGALKDYVTQNAETFKALGVNIDATQPSYWDVATGTLAAIYNHTVLQAQAESTTNPLGARDLAIAAANITNGAETFDTLGGKLTFQDIQQAAQTPNMFQFDAATGGYVQTTETGYQYQTFTDTTGKSYQALVPTYSGIVGAANSSNVFFLTPTETAMATKLGLNFTQTDVNKEVGAGHQVGAGVQVQVGENSPAWLKAALGEGAVTTLFTDQNGDIIFKGNSTSGKGESYYTLTQNSNGLAGLFEHTLDGSLRLAGGDYGFRADVAQMVMNQAQHVQQTISIQKQIQQAELKLAAPPLPVPGANMPHPLSVAPPQPAQQPLRVAAPRLSRPTVNQPTFNPQTTAPSPQQTFNPQQSSGGISLQGGSSGFNLNQSGGGTGIRVGGR